MCVDAFVHSQTGMPIIGIAGIKVQKKIRKGENYNSNNNKGQEREKEKEREREREREKERKYCGKEV